MLEHESHPAIVLAIVNRIKRQKCSVEVKRETNERENEENAVCRRHGESLRHY